MKILKELKTMRKRTKTIMSSFLALSMMLSSTFADLSFVNEPQSVFAEISTGRKTLTTDDYTMNYILYADDGGIVCIQKIYPSETGAAAIKIPETVDGYPVRYILSGCFSECSDAETIELPSEIESIEASAFENCKSLKSITLPDTVTLIGYSAFSGCTSLTSVVLPQQLENISSRLFENCSSLTSVSISENVRSVSDYAFSGSAIENITLPGSDIYFADYSFSKMKNLKSITISPYLHKINPDIFPENVEIKYDTDVNVIDGVIFSKDMKKLLNYPLNYHDDVFEYTVPSSVEEICDNAFFGTKISKITFSENLKYIGSNAFTNCRYLEHADFNGSCPKFGNCVFSNCGLLKELLLPEGITVIPAGTFMGCTGIYTGIIPDSVKVIESDSMPCEMDSVYIPSGVETIEHHAFSDNTVICAQSGTAAEKYAYSNRLRFVSDTFSKPEDPDVNKDGEINILDIIYLKNHLNEGTSNSLHNYDINHDNRINIKDLREMLDYFTCVSGNKGYRDIKVLRSDTDTGLKTIEKNYHSKIELDFITDKSELEEFFEENCINNSDVKSYTEKYQDYLEDYVIGILNISNDSLLSIKGFGIYSMEYDSLFADRYTSYDNSLYTVLVPRRLYWGQNICIMPDDNRVVIAKPVIYLYPEDETEINVKIITDQKTQLSTTYPKYSENEGWTVTAKPDSTLYDKNGREYSYLFWDAYSSIKWDMSEGFVVKGEDTVEFLQDKLEYLGLTPKEYNDFIVYWLPMMEKNRYNLISFQTEDYDNSFKLEITPKPDSIQRVFMTFKALDEYIDVPEQSLKPFKRHGYSVIEWGGSEVK